MGERKLEIVIMISIRKKACKMYMEIVNVFLNTSSMRRLNRDKSEVSWIYFLEDFGLVVLAVSIILIIILQLKFP